MTEFSADIDAALAAMKVKQATNVRTSRNGIVKTEPVETARLEMDGDTGTLVTRPLPADQSPEWDDLLRLWDLDPAQFEIIEPVRFNSWESQGTGGEVIRLKQYKAAVKRREAAANYADLESLITEIGKRKPRKTTGTTTGEGDFCVVLADWQTGKGEGGGSKALVERVTDAIEAVEVRVKELRKAGRSLGALNVIWPGDSVEGCGNHYAMQTFQTDLDRRGQIKLATRLLDAALTRWSKIFETVRVVAVGGNHGENRKGGKAYTTFADNDDLLIVENVALAYSKNPEVYGHIEFILPDDHLNAVVRIANGHWSLGVTHGHLSRGGNSPEGKIQSWYNKMAGGKHAIGQVDVLVTGHYHHYRAVDWGGCQWLQAPALDGGSEWFEKTSGMYSEPGVLTFCSYPERRIDDIKIL